MRFKNHHQTSQLPEIELTPMLNVMMGILAFFVMITMSLTTQQGVDVELPNAADSEPVSTTAPDPLVVQVNSQRQLLIGEQPTTEEQLAGQMQAYLTRNQQGFVVLQASPDLPYEQVVQLLSDMRTIGGDRVSLAID